MNEMERMIAGRLYNPYRVESQWLTIRAAVKRFNDSCFWMDQEPLNALKKLFGSAGEKVVLVNCNIKSDRKYRSERAKRVEKTNCS